MQCKSNKFNKVDSTTGLDKAFKKACQAFSVLKLYPEQKKSFKSFHHMSGHVR